MSSPFPYLVRMLLFMVAVVGLAYLLHTDLLRVFLNTPILNGVIVAVLLIGIFFVMRQVISLWPEVQWLRRFQHREPGAPPLETDSINLLAPLATMLGERQDRLRLSPTVARAVLDGIATRLDERRELTRYLIGLLIFLGLLGTFWGLLETIGSVADAITKLQVGGTDPVQMFARLKESIEGPLKGMSTAFGASLFGLSGSLVLGFLELQASQAQGRFHIELEEWLASSTKLSSNVQSDGEQGVSAYVEALLERTADGLDDLTRTLRRAEEGREATAVANSTLIERLASLAETMRNQQLLLARMGEQSIELRTAIGRLGDRGSNEDDRDGLQAHQRAIEAYLARLIEESVRGRTALADELRGELRLLARTVASTRGTAPPGEG
jgi:biopolymer transport protein ExbB/TolQ